MKLRNAHWWLFTVGRKPSLIYTATSLLVLLPLMPMGYILTLDMVFTPVIRVPEYVSSSYLFYVLLHVLDVVLAADVIQKLLLFLILFLSGLGMHRLILYREGEKKQPIFDSWGAYFGGVLYMINPFTYDRFMAGQFAVLLGYALLPWFVGALLKFLKRPALRPAIITAGWAIVISIASIHSIGLMIMVILGALAMHAKEYWEDTARLRLVLKCGLLALMVFVAASSYWLVPLAQGTGATAATVAGFDAGDQQAFATIGDTALAKLSNVMQLQGFWLEQQGQYELPQHAVAAWGVLVIVIWAMVVTGIVRLRRARRSRTVTFFGILIIGGWLLAAGIFSTWLARYIPLFGGYREPQKFTALTAMGYAVLAGYGMTAIVERYGRHSRIKSSLIAIMTVMLLLGFTRPMVWGFNGQLLPRQYPADWFTMNDQLNHDQTNFKVLFLPWHLYMSYDFSERIIATPAVKFFDKAMIVNQNPEFERASPSKPTAEQALLNNHILPAATHKDELGSQLSLLNIKYVLLAKELDYSSYKYLDTQKDLQIVQESATLKLYRNKAFREEK